MKKIFIFLTAALAVMACNKQENPSAGMPVDAPDAQESLSDVPILFSAGMPETRATEVTTSNLSTIYVTATKGTGSSTSAAWNNATFFKSGSYFKNSPGKYWPNSDENYHFFAANVALPTSGTSVSISPSGVDTDIVVGKATSPVYKANGLSGNATPLTLDHIYAQIGTVDVTVNSDLSSYSISNLRIYFNGYTSGSFDISAGQWGSTKTGASRMDLVGTSSAGVSIAAGGTFSQIANTSHRLVIPMEGSGTLSASNAYAITATFTITKGDYTKDVSRSGFIQMVQGKRNNVNATLSLGSDGATEIQFNVTVTDWVDQVQNVTF